MSFRRIPDEPVYRLPQPPAPSVTPATVVVCPLFLSPGPLGAPVAWQASLYRAALEQALMAARPSLPERDLLGVWN